MPTSSPLPPRRLPYRWLPGLVLAAAILLPATGRAEDEPRPAYRGSSVTLRNAASAVSLNPAAELTYNPYYGLALGLDGRWWFGDSVFARGRFDLGREVTEADQTTYAGEIVPGELVLGGGVSRFYEIPGAGILVSAALDLRLPTSKVAQARSLIVGIEPSITFRRPFDVLGGLSVGYTLAPAAHLHRYTTAQRETPLLPICSPAEVACGPYIQNGVRNAAWSHAHTLSATLQATPRVGFTAVAGVHVAHLYALGTDDRVSFEPQDPQDVRFTNIWALEASYGPMPSLTVSVGASTVNPQLAPDSSFYPLVFNRYTQLYVDLRLNPAGLVAQLSSGGSR